MKRNLEKYAEEGKKKLMKNNRRDYSLRYTEMQELINLSLGSINGTIKALDKAFNIGIEAGYRMHNRKG